MSEQPHYSRVKLDTQFLNVVTGRSLNYGFRPWRCTDRLDDFLGSIISRDSFVVKRRLFSLMMKCARSEPGDEPTDNYRHLSREEVEFFAERYQSRMLKAKLVERAPYDPQQIDRVFKEDALKMRVFRHQRILEMESREGKIDEVIHMNVFGKKFKPS